MRNPSIKNTLLFVLIGLVFTLSACSQVLPTQAPNFLQLAEQSYREGKLEEAHQYYSKAIEQKDSMDAAYAGRGKVFSTWRRFDEAVADYSASLEIVRTADVLSSRCIAYRIQHKFDLAKADCDEALTADPQLAIVYVANALLQIEQGDLDSARRILEDAEGKNVKSAELYYVMFEIENATGDINKALELINKAIALDATQPQFYWSRAFIHYSQAKIDEAKEDLNLLITHAKPGRDDELLFKATNLLNNLGR